MQELVLRFVILLGSDACMLSMDDMAKIKVRAPAVSRYHQVRRLFTSTDMPNLSDRSFPVPNYLLSVSRYMYLEQMNDESDDSDLPTYKISLEKLGLRDIVVNTGSFDDVDILFHGDNS